MLAKQYLIIHRSRNLDIVKPVKVIVRFLLTTSNVFRKHSLSAWSTECFPFFVTFAKKLFKMCKKEYFMLQTAYGDLIHYSILFCK